MIVHVLSQHVDEIFFKHFLFKVASPQELGIFITFFYNCLFTWYKVIITRSYNNMIHKVTKKLFFNVILPYCKISRKISCQNLM